MAWTSAPRADVNRRIIAAATNMRQTGSGNRYVILATAT